MMHRRAVFAAVALLAVAPAAWGQPNYALTDLGKLPGYGSSWAQGINASGQVVGYSVSGSIIQAFLYSGGSMQGPRIVPRLALRLGDPTCLCRRLMRVLSANTPRQVEP